MAKERPGIMLYFDILPALEKMDANDAGRIFVAMRRYAKSGECTPVFPRSLTMREICRFDIENKRRVTSGTT